MHTLTHLAYSSLYFLLGRLTKIVGVRATLANSHYFSREKHTRIAVEFFLFNSSCNVNARKKHANEFIFCGAKFIFYLIEPGPPHLLLLFYAFQRTNSTHRIYAYKSFTGGQHHIQISHSGQATFSAWQRKSIFKRHQLYFGWMYSLFSISVCHRLIWQFCFELTILLENIVIKMALALWEAELAISNWLLFNSHRLAPKMHIKARYKLRSKNMSKWMEITGSEETEN